MQSVMHAIIQSLNNVCHFALRIDVICSGVAAQRQTTGHLEWLALRYECV